MKTIIFYKDSEHLLGGALRIRPSQRFLGGASRHRPTCSQGILLARNDLKFPLVKVIVSKIAYKNL